MMGSFIYVFNTDDRDVLCAKGFHVLKSDEANNVFIFVNEPEIEFALGDISYVASDVLTF